VLSDNLFVSDPSTGKVGLRCGSELALFDNVVRTKEELIAVLEQASKFCRDKKVTDEHTLESYFLDRFVGALDPHGSYYTASQAAKTLLVSPRIVDGKFPTDVSCRGLGGGIGYAKIGKLSARADDDLGEALNTISSDKEGLNGLLLDLRDNPGGLLQKVEGVVGMFVKSGLMVGYTDARLQQNKARHFGRKGAWPNLPVVVLVNARTSGVAEYAAGALQDLKRAVVVGTHTAGKGSAQTVIPLDNGTWVRLTTMRFFLPSGHSIDGDGVKPDIVLRDADDSTGGANDVMMAQSITAIRDLVKIDAGVVTDEVLDGVRKEVVAGSR
jgi:C-terminal processing protease CtpA/Prc